MPRILHRLEVGGDFYQDDTDAAQLSDVYKIPDGFHEFLRAFLTVLHHGLVACPVCVGKFVLRKRFTANGSDSSIVSAPPLPMA